MIHKKNKGKYLGVEVLYSCHYSNGKIVVGSILFEKKMSSKFIYS